jgi:hypothetical protein
MYYFVIGNTFEKLPCKILLLSKSFLILNMIFRVFQPCHMINVLCLYLHYIFLGLMQDELIVSFHHMKS